MSALVTCNTEKAINSLDLTNLNDSGLNNPNSPRANLKTDKSENNYNNSKFKENEIELKNQFPYHPIYGYCRVSDPLTEKDKLIGTPISDKMSNSRYSYYSNVNKYEEFVSLIDLNGSIEPHGKIIETPKKIKMKGVLLKPHQKRTLYEMVLREQSEYRLLNKRNLCILSNDVGSGKSIEILSLIAYSKMTKLWNNSFYCNNDMRDSEAKKYHLYGYSFNKKNVTELESNLLIIPHNIYNQWASYIKDNTGLEFYGIDKRKKIANLFKTKFKKPEYEECFPGKKFPDTYSKDEIEKYKSEYNEKMKTYLQNYTKEVKSKIDKYDIICVKSTMFKDFSKAMTAVFGDIRKGNENFIPIKISSHSSLISTFKSFTDTSVTNLRGANTEKSTLEKIDEIHENYLKWRNSIERDKISDCSNVEPCIMNHNLDKGYIFQRVIIDEVDSITVPAFPNVAGKFLWFVSSSINNILYPRGKSRWLSGENCRKIISSGIGGSGFLRDTLNCCTGNESCPSTYDGKTLCRIFKVIIKHNPSFVKESISLPEIIKNYVSCYTPIGVSAVANCVNSKILAALNAGDTEAAKAMLGYQNTSDETSFIEIVTMKLTKELQSYENDLKAKKKKLIETEKVYEDVKNLTTSENIKKINNPNKYKSLCLKITQNLLKLHSTNLEKVCDEYLYKTHSLILNFDNYGGNEYAVKIVSKFTKEMCSTIKGSLSSRISSYKESITSYETKIVDVNVKINGIKERLQNTEDKDCPICVSKVKDPCVTPCCKNVFCFECLGTALKYSKHSACPMCRTSINMKNINLIVKHKTDKSKNKTKKENDLPTKLEALMAYIKENKNKRILVFSEYDFHKIVSEFDDLSINYSKINGSSDRIRKILEKFKNGEFQVLLLNATNFGAGLNLQFTDDIVIFHRMAKDLERQVIGRAQRLGRKVPLRINYLCHENEKKHYNKK